MNASMHIALAALGDALYVLPLFPYLAAIRRGETRPSIATWLGWSVLVAIIIAAQIAKGASWSLALPILSDAMNIIVLVYALRYGGTKISRADLAMLGLAGVALAAWVLTNNPLNALLLSLAADALVSVPTIIKTWRDPRSEPWGAWALYALGALLGGLSTTVYDAANLAYPAYLFVLCALITALSLRRSGRNVLKL